MRAILMAMLALAVCPAWAGPDAAAAAEPHHGAALPADARFEFLKGLAGTWVGTLPEGEGRFEFRVTAGGHAVLERELVGTPMEMLTVYHMEGKELRATHYCMLGNRPEAKAASSVVGGELVFGCTGRPGNAGSHDDEHVHGWSMRLDAEGRLHYGAELRKDGQVVEHPAFVLTRTEETAARR